MKNNKFKIKFKYKFLILDYNRIFNKKNNKQILYNINLLNSYKSNWIKV